MIIRRRCLVRLLTSIGLATTLLLLLDGRATEGQERVNVTVQQLLEQKHRLEITAGSEIVWNDPHFDSVWFPAAVDNPKVRREGGRLRTIFPRPGTYRGAFTVVGGHAMSDVYHMVVVVTPRSP
jgi:hypothetical protein